MKKYLISAILAVMSFGVKAEYNRLIFRTVSGEEQSVGVTNLNITYFNGEMVASSGTDCVRIPLTSLISMEFSETNSLPEISIVDMEEMDVYSLDGIYLGNFDSKKDVMDSMPSGLYVLKTKNGGTYKISISK